MLKEHSEALYARLYLVIFLVKILLIREASGTILLLMLLGKVRSNFRFIMLCYKLDFSEAMVPLVLLL